MTNPRHTVLYIGVTNDLVKRVWLHQQKMVEGFTKCYNCTKLVYVEGTADIREAIQREKQLKNWHRQWKINLVAQQNPTWRDLSEDRIPKADRDAETSSA